ncbi:MAG: alpha/beta fold hydrolase [Gammaproteobacteria bacterium]|nr:alpha/beta fold hydrolase [Gammaproteobacteria bacterium]
MKTVLLIIAAVVAVALLVTLAWAWTPDRALDELKARYTNGPDDFRDIAGTRIHLRDEGPRDAPAVILLHGFGASLHTWEPWAASLADEFRVVTLDLPGGGLSGRDPTGDYSDTRSMEILASLMDELGLAQASLVGNSMGGRIAWRFAAEFPERVERLVLIAPDGFASPGFEYGVAPEVPAVLRLMRHALPRSVLRMNLQAAYADPGALSAPVVRRYHDLMLAPGNRDALLDRMAQVMLEPPEPLLARIEAPTLLVWGEKDAMVPFTNAADYLAALPTARLVSFEDLGHVPHEEAPERSVVPVREFLAERAP